MSPFAIARRALLLVATTGIVAACAKDGGLKKPKKVSRLFKHEAVWAPATLTEVQGVPIATLKTSIGQRLAAAAPDKVDEEGWKHTRALYKRFGETPLWFTSDGLARDRVKALTDAVLSVTKDGLRVDAYPLSELTNALNAVRQTKTPTAEQVTTADVLLSAMYASLGEDLLTGQVSPKDVNQAWHIANTDDDVDSALVHVMGDTLEAGIAEMRPADEEYATLGKELARYRAIVAKGDWPKVPSGKAVKEGQSDTPARIDALRQRLAAEGYNVAGAAAGT